MGKEVVNFYALHVSQPSSFSLTCDSCYQLVSIAAEDEEMGPDGKKIRPGISNSVIETLTECNAALSQQRKRRQVISAMEKTL